MFLFHYISNCHWCDVKFCQSKRLFIYNSGLQIVVLKSHNSGYNHEYMPRIPLWISDQMRSLDHNLVTDLDIDLLPFVLHHFSLYHAIWCSSWKDQHPVTPAEGSSPYCFHTRTNWKSYIFVSAFFLFLLPGPNSQLCSLLPLTGSSILLVFQSILNEGYRLYFWMAKSPRINGIILRSRNWTYYTWFTLKINNTTQCSTYYVWANGAIHSMYLSTYIFSPWHQEGKPLENYDS